MGFRGLMEKKMETLGPFKELCRVYIGVIYWGYIGIMEKKMETTIMENQMEKKMENEMETGV